MRALLHITAASLLLSTVSYADEIPLKRLNHSSYNVNEGLIHSSIADIAEDGNGFVWFSAGNGLQRFDGRKFTSIPVSDDSRGIPDDKYVSLLGLQNGNLWLFHRRGISEYNRTTNRFKHTNVGQLSNEALTPVVEESDGVWCWDGRTVYHIDKKTFKVSDSIALPAGGSYVDFALVNTHDGRSLFAVLSSTEMHIVDKESKQQSLLKPTSSQGKFLSATNFREGELLVATMRGIEKLDVATRQFSLVCGYKTKLSAFITRLTIKLQMLRNGRCIVAEGVDIYELDVNHGKYVSRLVSLQNNNFIDVGWVTQFYSDSHNNLWLISESIGIRKIFYPLSKFKYYGLADQRKNFAKNVVVDKADNRVLCGTLNHGLLVYDTSQHLLRHVNHFPGATPQPTVSSILKLHTHRYLIFLAGNFDAYLLNSRNFSLVKVRLDVSRFKLENVFDYHMNAFSEDGSTLILQNSFYIYRVKWESPATLRFVEYSAMPTASVSSYLDNRRRLWVGAKGKYYLFSHGIKSKWSYDLPEPLLVRCFYSDNSGNTWMGTEKGLYELNSSGTVQRRYSSNDGLADENIYSIREVDGNLWLSHNKGISCRRADGVITHYTRIDGLQENEFNTNSSAQSQDGELYFGGVNGINSFHPAELLSDASSPTVFLTSLKVKDRDWGNDTAIWKIEKVLLQHNMNNVAFKFSANGRRPPGEYIYQYRMKGIDAAWINAGADATAHYVIPPGRYTFEMYAGNSFDNNAVALNKIIFIIQPPFWQKTWFLALVGLVTASLTIIITRFAARAKLRKLIGELERQRFLDQERLRISREMHDDIGTGLTQITLLTEAARSRGYGGHQLDEIARTSRKLVGSMSEIIWSMNPENNTLDQLYSYLREQLNQLLEYSKMSYSISFPEAGGDVMLNNAERRNIVLVAKEIVNNCIKHSQAQHLAITSKHENSLLQFYFDDNGLGFDCLKTNSGNGLKNIKRRIQELGGEMKIDSVEGKGTQYFFQVPLRIASSS